MEKPTPFDLNEAIRRWQQNLGASPAFKADNLEELASHLRASVQKLMADGISEEEAFQIATQRIGERGSLEREFAKVNPAVNRSLPVILFWIVAGIYILQLVYVVPMVVLFLGLLLSKLNLDFLPFFKSFSKMVHWLAYCEMPNLCRTAFLLVVVLAFCLCWRLITGGWKGFRVFAISRFEGLARTKPILTALCLAAFAIVAFCSATIAIICSSMYFNPDASYGVNWGSLAGDIFINAVLVLTMVFLARRGLRKISPTDGTLHDRTVSGSR
ncbi:MAG: permease prefix domain 1-containing protein [Limisphaerales bacterium]